MPTIDAAEPFAENPQRRLDDETLISELSSRFIDLRAGEVDREIEDALRPKAIVPRWCGRGSSGRM